MSQHKKALGMVDMTLFTVSAILFLDTLAGSASMGAAALTFWLVFSVLFFLPFGLITSEMGTAYPEQGGIYAWVRDALGKRWGTRVTWLYWVNLPIWSASIFVMFTSILSQLFWPDLELGGQLVLAILFNWVVVGFTCMPLKYGKWIPNAGALVKMVAFGALIIAGVLHALDPAKPLTNDFSVQAFIPEWGSGVQYIAIVIWGMVGFELMSAASDEMENPVRDIPRATLFSGLIIIFGNVLGIFAVLAVIPAEDINMVEGLVDTFLALFGDSGMGRTLAIAMSVCFMFSLLSNAVTWSLGANRTIAKSAQDGEMPAFLGYEHPKYGTPVGAGIVVGVLVTLLLGFYGLVATSNEELFWLLFAAQGVIFMTPYMGAIFAFMHARINDPDRERPFRIPGGKPVAWLVTVLCFSCICMSVLLFMYVPGEGFDWPVVIGGVTALALGEITLRYSEIKRSRRD